MNRLSAVIGAAMWAVCACLAPAQELRAPASNATIKFEGRSWAQIRADRVALEEFRGRKAVHVTGFNQTAVYLPGSEFRDGTIEVDLSPSGRATPGIGFGGLTDNGWRNQVLFNYWPGRREIAGGMLEQAVVTRRSGTVVILNLRDSANTPSNQGPEGWFHVRIVVQGDTLTVFLDDEQTPIITLGSVVDEATGEVGLCGSNFHFANFQFTSSP